MSSLSAEAMTSSQLPSFTSKADVKKPCKIFRTPCQNFYFLTDVS